MTRFIFDCILMTVSQIQVDIHPNTGCHTDFFVYHPKLKSNNENIFTKS